MGDVRYERHLDRLTSAEDPARELRRLEDEAVIEALAAAARQRDPYLTNIIASEAENRMVRARAVMNGLSEGVVVLDVDGRIMFANRTALNLLGRQRGDLDRADLASLLPGGAPTAPFLERLVTACGGDPVDDVELGRADGSTFEASCSSSRLVRDDVEMGLVVVFSDVTQRKRREREEHRRTALYRSLLEALGDVGVGVVVGDGERIVHANRAVVDLLGYTLEELSSLPSAVALMDESRLPEVQAFLGTVDTRARLSPPFSVPLVSKKGERLPRQVRLRTVDVDGASYFVAFLTPT